MNKVKALKQIAFEFTPPEIEETFAMPNVQNFAAVKT